MVARALTTDSPTEAAAARAALEELLRWRDQLTALVGAPDFAKLPTADQIRIESLQLDAEHALQQLARVHHRLGDGIGRYRRRSSAPAPTR
jgi:hypothetical protein